MIKPNIIIDERSWTMMIKTIRVMLLPNNRQKTKLFQYAGASRWAYNWSLVRQQENYKNGGKFISDNDLRKELTQLKKTEEYAWLNNVSNNVTKQAIKDACDSYKRFFKGLSRFPKFKSRKKSAPSFYQDPIKIKFSETHVKLEGLANSKKENRRVLNYVKLSEHNRIPSECKYYNPRIKFDGLNWWITVGIDNPIRSELDSCHDDGIGVDLGLKNLAICSNGGVYRNVNKENKVKRIKKKLRRLQRKVSKKYLINKKGERYCKTSNIIKAEKAVLKVHKRLNGIRHNYLQQTTSEIVNRKPMFITLEDLNVSGMMNNRHLSKAIGEQSFYEFRRLIEYKANWSNIPVVIADRFYPSSKTCCECGYVHKGLKLSDRIYHCPECENSIDRDYQASLNLKKYGEKVLQSVV